MGAGSEMHLELVVSEPQGEDEVAEQGTLQLALAEAESPALWLLPLSSQKEGALLGSSCPWLCVLLSGIISMGCHAWLFSCMGAGDPNSCLHGADGGQAVPGFSRQQVLLCVKRAPYSPKGTQRSYHCFYRWLDSLMDCQECISRSINLCNIRDTKPGLLRGADI